MGRGPVTALALGTKKDLVVAANGTESLSIWNFERAEPLAFIATTSPVNSLSLLEQSGVVVCASQAGTVDVWPMSGSFLLFVRIATEHPECLGATGRNSRLVRAMGRLTVSAYRRIPPRACA
jgi:hypothetical protein